MFPITTVHVLNFIVTCLSCTFGHANLLNKSAFWLCFHIYKANITCLYQEIEQLMRIRVATASTCKAKSRREAVKDIER